MAKKLAFTEAEQSEITLIQQAFSISRKAAIRKMRSANKQNENVAATKDFKSAAATDQSETVATMDAVSAQPEPTGLVETKSEPRRRSKKAAIEAYTIDVKALAANDQPKSEVSLTRKAISARGAGVKLYQLAGRPTKSDFIKLCGKKSPAMTWIQRAEHLGVATPEEAAQKFAEAKGGK
jgi:hypothetical protein